MNRVNVKSGLILMLGLGLGLLLSGAAHALSTDREQPINIESDKVYINESGYINGETE